MGGKYWYLLDAPPRNLPGGGVVGMFDGHGELVKWFRCYDLIRAKDLNLWPNDLLNGPRFNR